MRRLIEAVLEEKGKSWKKATKTTFVTDANAILEALLLQYGVEAAVEALVNQGRSETSNYTSSIRRLYEKACERRDAREA